MYAIRSYYVKPSWEAYLPQDGEQVIEMDRITSYNVCYTKLLRTTTFYSIVGFIRPTKGSILLDGEDITELPIHKRASRGITYLAQEPSVFKKLTVEENIRNNFV